MKILPFLLVLALCSARAIERDDLPEPPVKMQSVPPIGHSAEIARGGNKFESIHGEEKMYFLGPPAETDLHDSVLYARDPVTHLAYLGVVGPTWLLVPLSNRVVAIDGISAYDFTYSSGDHLPTDLQKDATPAAVWEMLDREPKRLKAILEDMHTVQFPWSLIKEMYGTANVAYGYQTGQVETKGDTLTLTFNAEKHFQPERGFYFTEVSLVIDTTKDRWEITRTFLDGKEFDFKQADAAAEKAARGE